MRVSIFELEKAEDTLQLGFICFERQIEYNKLASILYDEYKFRLQSVDALILRPAVDKPIENISNELEEIKWVIERFPHIPIYLLYSTNYVIHFSGNLNTAIDLENDTLKPFPPESIINDIRQKELEDFILNSASIFRSPENTIYRTPSNEYSHFFARVGNIQISRNVLDAIFFWCIPFLRNAGSILTDSWSISSIALNISRLLCRYDKNVSIDNFHVNMLTAHYNGEKKLDKETENNLYALAHENQKGILFLISAVKTLKSLENIKKVFTNVNIENRLDYLAMYRLTSASNIEHLCDLSGNFSVRNSINFDSYTEPPKNESVIEIDDKIFFPLEVKETEIWVGQYCTKMNESFFRKYEGKSVLYLHRDSFYSSKVDKFRHHGIYIDVTNMLQCPVFRNAIENEVDKLERPPALIIFPPHEHGKDLVDAIKADIQKKFGIDIEAHQVLDIDFLSRKDSDPLVNKLTELKDDDLIMVVDDVSTTGARLKNYQKRLRYAYRGQIHYFIGVARPEKEQIWNKRVKELTFRPGAVKHKVTSVEKVYLPDWDEKSCPWCSEKEIITKVVSKAVNSTYPLTRSLKERYFKLQVKTETGLQNDVFFSINASIKPSFQGGSIFAKETNIAESDLVAIVASAIQSIRNDGGIIDEAGTKINFQTEYPHFKIINITDYMGENSSFNEALVRAAILRSASKTELLAKNEKNRNRQALEVEKFFSYASIGEHEVCFFIYELYLALKGSKLPKPNSPKKLIKYLEDAYNFQPTGS